MLAQVVGHLDVVRDDHDCHAALAVELLQQAQDRQGGVRVERRGRFVAQQNRGRRGQGTRNRHTLALAARELGRVRLLPVRQAHGRQCLARRGAACRAVHTGHLERELHVMQGAAVRQQVELLEDHADTLARLAQRVLGQAHEFLAVDAYRAAAGLFEPVYQAQQGTFAGAGKPEQPEHLAGRNRQVGRQQGVYGLATYLEALGDLLQLNHG